MYSMVILANYTVLITGWGRACSLFSEHPFFLSDLWAQSWPSGFAEVPPVTPATLWLGIRGREQSRPCVSRFLIQCCGRSWVGASPWLLRSSRVSWMAGLRGLVGGDFWRAAGLSHSSLPLLPQPRACTESVLQRWALGKWVKDNTGSQQEGELGRRNKACRWGVWRGAGRETLMSAKMSWGLHWPHWHSAWTHRPVLGLCLFGNDHGVGNEQFPL